MEYEITIERILPPVGEVTTETVLKDVIYKQLLPNDFDVRRLILSINSQRRKKRSRTAEVT